MSGGTGSASTAGLDTTSTKDSYIPLFSGAPSDYKEWRKRLTIYVMKMRMAKREAEGLLSVIRSLTGRAWKLLGNFPIEDIEKAGAFEKILKILDKAFEYDKTVQLPHDFDKYFISLHRRAGQSLLEYTTEPDHLYNKLADHHVTLPDKVQGWHLLRKAGLSKEQKQLVTAQAPSMERHKVQEAMFLILGQDHKTVAGGQHQQHHRGFRGKGRAYAAYYEGEDYGPEDDEWPDDGGWEEGYYENDDNQTNSPLADSYADETHEDFDTDAAYYQTLEDTDPNEQAEEFDSAYATYLDARKRFNEIKLSRGYLPIVALTDGNLSPGAASPHSSGSPVSPGRGGKGKTKKGKGKGGSNTVKYPPRGRGKEPDPKGRAAASGTPPTCLRCGQVGHMTYNCPVPKSGASKRKTAPTESTVDHSEHGHVIFSDDKVTNAMTVPCWTLEHQPSLQATDRSCATSSSSRRLATTSTRSSSCAAIEPFSSVVMPVWLAPGQYVFHSVLVVSMAMCRCTCCLVRHLCFLDAPSWKLLDWFWTAVNE